MQVSPHGLPVVQTLQHVPPLLPPEDREGEVSVITKFCRFSSHSMIASSPVLGKFGTRYMPLAPRRNSVPNVATEKMASANSTPSSNTRMVCGPGPVTPQFHSAIKPFSPSLLQP